MLRRFILQIKKGDVLPVNNFMVANASSNNVSIIDADTNLVIVTTAVGNSPFGVAFGSNKFMVTNRLANNVSIIDANTNLVITTTPVGSSPFGVAFGNGKFVVTNRNSNNVTIIDANTNLVIATIDVGTAPFGVAFGNNRFVVANEISSDLSIIDANSNLVIDTTPVGGSPFGVTSGNNKFVVSHRFSSNVSVIDANTNLVIGTITVGSNPNAVGFGNNKFVVANRFSNNISIIDANTDLVIATTSVGDGPNGVAFGNNKFMVSNTNLDNVSVIDADTNLVIDATPVGNGPGGVAYSALQTQDDIAHTFNSLLGYEGDLSKDKIGQQTREIQRGRAYSFDGVDDYISAPHITSQSIAFYEGTSTLSISSGRIDGTAGTAYNILLSDGTRYNCDEGSGTIAYDSSGNGQHGTLINGIQHITLTDGNGADWQNQVGYSEVGGVLVPRNEAIPTQDVQGNLLQYSGRVKYDAELIGRGYFFDGADDYVSLVGSSALIADFSQDREIESVVSIEKRQVGFSRILSLRAIGSVLIISMNDRDINFAIGSTAMTFAYTILPLGGDDKATFSFLVKHTNGGNLEIFIDGNLEYSQPLGSFTNPTTTPARIGAFSSGDVIEGKIGLMRISYTGSDTLLLKMDEGSGLTSYDSSGNGNNGALINGVSHATGKGLGAYRQTNGHTQSGLVTIPRNEAIPTEDVLGNPLQYPGDGFSLLPSGQVDFNPGLAPELIKKNAPTDYEYGDTLPPSMTKTVEPNKEKDFIIS